MTESLGALVRSRWETLLSGDFELTQEEPGRLLLDSERVSVVVAVSPRGEVDVTVMPRGSEWPRQWSWSVMVGHADIARLLDLALDEMLAEPKVLAGDTDLYDRLTDANQAKSRALTSRAEGKTPTPDQRRLP